MRLAEPVRRSHTIVELKAVICSLLKRGLRNGVLLIGVEGTDFSLKVRKYLYPQGNFGVNVCLPRAPWSIEYFTRFEDYCRKHGLNFFVERDNGGEGTEFICVDCGKDIEQAHKLVQIILTKIFCIPGSEKFFSILENVSPWDEEIQSPYQQPLSFREGMKRYNEAVKASSGITIWDTCLCVGLGLLQLFGVLGLLYSAIFADPTWQRLSFYVGNIGINAPLFQIICIVLICIGMLRLLTLTFRRRINAAKILAASVGSVKAIRFHVQAYTDWLNLVSLIAFFLVH